MAAAVPLLERKYVKNKSSLLNAAIQIGDNEGDRREEILSHIKAVEHDSEFLLDQQFHQFPPDSTWFNSSRLSLGEGLQGKVVVLDFFTYCCINCMHILPDLAQLERAHSVEDGLVVIGVHSAKFLNEKLSKNIENAVRRYDIHHPVVNDSDIVLWNSLGVVCWPTLVIIGPDNQLLHYIIGEGHGKELKLFIDTALQYYSDTGRLSRASIPTSVHVGGGGKPETTGVLSYPGKLCCDGERLYVSDTGHHRVVVLERETRVVSAVYGSGVPGLRDGESREAQFHSPQGLVWNGDNLYVADTENHVIRKVDLVSGHVTTVAGTGVQGSDKEGGNKGVQQEISSPWDLALGGRPDPDSVTDEASVLWIAMAGTHQIWTHFLSDTQWIKGRACEHGVTLRFSGSGEEANRNNTYSHKACFAQPSGITQAAGGSLYVADSESSTVRCVAVKDGSVKAVVGGAIDPLDLFAYGDTDGKGRDVRLQHPLGVTWSKRERLVYVADSYNHKIKVVDPATKRCTTLAGTGQSGLVDGPFEHAQFSEPGGLCLDPAGRTLFVADTNNHAIRVLDLDQKSVTQLNIHFPEISGQTQPPSSLAQPSPPFKRLTGRRAQTVQCESVAVQPEGGVVILTIGVSLPASCQWTSGATSAWQIVPDSAVLASCDPGRRGVIEADKDIVLSLTGLHAESSSIQVELLLYFCEPLGVCHMAGALLIIPLCPDQSAPTSAEATIQYEPEIPKTF